jgi:hypothetical protein
VPAVKPTDPTGISALSKLQGDGKTAFADFMKKNYSGDLVMSKTDRKSVDWAKTAENLEKKGVELYIDNSGNALLYDQSTRSGGAFSPNGGSLATPTALYPGHDNMKQSADYAFDVGSMHVKFGGNKDTAGNTYGLQVTQG